MSTETKIEFMWNCAKALEGNQQTHKLLRSYYVNTCRKLATNNLKAPKQMFSVSQMCPYCGSVWNESEFQLKSIPKQLKLSSKEKKLIENYEKKADSPKTLNKTQKNRAKWLMKRQFKRLAIKCLQCKHKSFVKLENARNKSLMQPTKIEKNASTLKQSKEHLKAATEQKNAPTVSYTQPKSKKKKTAEKQTTSTCNNRTKPKNNNSSNKVISNTKKQNSLLQLAALLKRQTHVDGKTSSQTKLLQLLK